METHGTEQNNRRKFLRSTGLALVSLESGLLVPFASAPGEGLLPKPITLNEIANPHTEGPSTEMPNALPMNERVGIAIVGLGHFALSTILPAMAKSKFCKPVALVSGDANKARQVAAQYGVNPNNIYNYQNFENIKSNPEIAIVYIVLPPGLHAEYTIRSAKAGKHVLCEKPMANSVEEAESMIKACEQAGKKLMIAYRIQYSPCYRLLRQKIRDNELGKITVISSMLTQNTANTNHWRLQKKLAGGGSLPDVGIYCINTARFLTGEEPVEVCGQTYSTPGDPRFKEVEELANFTLTFPSGIIAPGTCSYGIHRSAYMHVGGAAKSGEVIPAFGDSNLNLKVSHSSPQGIDEVEKVELGEQTQCAAEMDHMAWCVINNAKPFTPGEEGLQDQKIMEAIYRSAAARQPVRLTSYNGLDVFRGAENGIG